MIRVELSPYTVCFEDLEAARDFLILATGAQRLVKLGRVGLRRLEPPRSSGTKTLDDIAERHARVPVRIAEATERALEEQPSRSAPAPRAPRRRRGPSPLIEHVTATETTPGPVAAAAVPVEAMGRRTGVNTKRINEATKSAALLEIVKRGAFDVRAAARELYKVDDLFALQRVQVLLTALRKQGLVENPSRGQWIAAGHHASPGPAPAREARSDESSAPKRATMEDLQAHVLAAFGADESYPVHALAAEMFTESTGRTVQKTRLVIQQLVANGKLERSGPTGFRVVEQDAGDGEGAGEPEDEPTDEDDGSGFDDQDLDAVASR